MKLNPTNDTIVALATAQGRAAIAVIRLSGSGALAIAGRIFRSLKNKNQNVETFKSHTLHFGSIVDKSTEVDEVLLAVMKGPHSYTGEDTVEISCHGSLYIQQEILRICQDEGARLAGPGEFTMRAFLNGRMDLSQAEAVAELIASDSATAHTLALKQMRGGFSNEIRELRSQLIHFASLIELELDFSEEDVEFASRDELKKVIERLRKIIDSLVESFELGNVIRKGIPVVIAGKPNAGKSTLLNALLNEERAIVSETAGTTRDTIEEEITIGGLLFRFIDTAGLRETTDAIEQVGVSKAYEKMKESPLVLYLVDASISKAEEVNDELLQLKSGIHEKVNVLPVGNKTDCIAAEEALNFSSSVPGILMISAKEKTNLEKLKEKFLSLYTIGQIDSNQTIVTNARHAEALKKTASALSSVIAGLTTGLTNDFLAVDLRQALQHLGSITGEISTEDLLENIFSRFCIGK